MSEETLLEIARRHGTPNYAYDLAHLRSQVAKLRLHLPDTVEVLYSLKANASLGLSGALATCGLGADVASTGEVLTAVEAGFPPERIFAAGPYKPPEMVSLLHSMPETIVSIDSSGELAKLAGEGLRNRALLRLRPDFESSAVVSAGAESRFGVPLEDLSSLHAPEIEVVGFHVFAGSQVLDAAALNGHIEKSMELSLKASEKLGIRPQIINLGGGFGIPYGPDEEELDLPAVGAHLKSVIERLPDTRVFLELGRFLVAQCGWYLTSVVGHQTNQGRKAVVVDGGTHQRADLCGLGLSGNAHPLVLGLQKGSPTVPTDVLGLLSLPADVLAQGAPLPPLSAGDVLAFPNAGAYGLGASPALFHAMPLPAEVAFEDGRSEVLRARKPASSVLEGQALVRNKAKVQRNRV